MPDALARGFEYGVGHRRSDVGGSSFASAARVRRAWCDMDLDYGHLVDPQRVVVVEVGLDDAAAVDGNSLAQYRTQAKHDSALHLLLNDGGIHDDSAIDRAGHLVHLQLAVCHGHLRHLGVKAADVVH